LKDQQKVGARLALFADRWKDLAPDSSLHELLREGYKLSFRVRPPLTTVPVVFPSPREEERRVVLEESVRDLLSKGAIEEVQELSRPAFYSRLFTVPKKTGGFRPVIDLSRLNKFLIIPRFKMETTRSLSKAIRIGDWAISLDLSDAYLHVPIHPDHRRYLRFCHEGKVYEFLCLPFGLSTAPWLFTRIVTTLAAVAHKKGMNLHTYLDDWLLRNQEKRSLSLQRDALISLTQHCGFLINFKKSSLEPTQDFVFIGVRFRTDLGIMLPPDKRIIDILDRTSSMKVATSVTARQFLSFLGLLNSAADQIPLGRLHMRPLQLFLLTQWKPVSRDLLHKIVLQHDLLQEVWNFWTDRSRLQEGVSLEQKTPDFTIETDASVQGWGAHLQGDQISGSWTSVQRLQHINVLEMLAMEEALFHWLPRFRGHVVQVLTDNSTVMYYIIKQGGTKSLSLCTLAWRILRWCKNNNISLVVKHIPGKRNVIADSLSRQHKLPGTEWTLLQSVVDHICKLSQHPMLDLFATSLNKRLPVYVSPLPDPLAMAMDALSISWDHLLAYAFPPTALLTPVLKKVQDSVNCQLVLVAPAWANQSWYPTLLHLSVDLPIQLPSQYNLLWHPVGRVFHANPALFNLHAWRVSSNTSKVADFRRKLPIESHPLNVNLPEESTIPDGRCSCLGVINGRRIHSIRLFQS
jgi:hypothetical protein